MKHLRIILQCALSGYFVNSINAQEQPLKQISIEDAKNYAVNHNYGVKSLKADIEVQEGEISIARSNFFPKLGIVGGIEVEGAGSDRETANLGYAYGTLNLFNGFADQNQNKKAFLLKDISESAYRKGESALRLDVEEMFYKYLHKKKNLEFLEESLKLNEKHLQSVRKRKASGLISDSDLMDFELRDSYLRSEINLIKQESAEIKLNLVRLMGPELGMNFEPKGALPHLHLEGTLNGYLEQVKSVTEDVLQTSYKTEAALMELRSKRSAWLPKVDIGVRFGSLPLDDRYKDKTNSYDAVLAAQWEFFSGFETSGQIKKADAELRKEELAARQALLSSMAGVETTIRKLQSIQQRVDLEEKNEERAQRLYRSTSSEFNRGIKNGADLKAAEQSLLEAKMRRAQLKSDFLETKMGLERLYSIPIKVSEFKDNHTKTSD